MKFGLVGASVGTNSIANPARGACGEIRAFSHLFQTIAESDDKIYLISPEIASQYQVESYGVPVYSKYDESRWHEFEIDYLFLEGMSLPDPNDPSTAWQTKLIDKAKYGVVFLHWNHLNVKSYPDIVKAEVLYAPLHYEPVKPVPLFMWSTWIDLPYRWEWENYSNRMAVKLGRFWSEYGKDNILNMLLLAFDGLHESCPELEFDLTHADLAIDRAGGEGFPHKSYEPLYKQLISEGRNVRLIPNRPYMDWNKYISKSSISMAPSYSATDIAQAESCFMGVPTFCHAPHGALPDWYTYRYEWNNPPRYHQQIVSFLSDTIEEFYNITPGCELDRQRIALAEYYREKYSREASLKSWKEVVDGLEALR